MADINSLTILGRLVRDMDLRQTPNGFDVGSFSIANNKSKKENGEWTKKTHFFDVVLLGKRATALQKYLVKGQQVVIEGEIEQDRWTDRESGASRSRVKIIANNINLVGGKGGGDSYSQNDSNPEPKQKAPVDDFDDEIPF